MKPNFTLCLLLLLLFSSSCSKDIKKRDITGRWDLFRSESRYHYVYPTTNEEVISYYLFENNIEVNTEYEDYQFSPPYKYGDTNYYSTNYIQINRDYTFEQKSELSNSNSNGGLNYVKRTSKGHWYFLSENVSLDIANNQRVCFIIDRIVEEYYSPNSEPYIRTRYFQPHETFFTWNISYIDKDEIRMASEFNYTIQHNLHVDLNGFIRSSSIYKKH